MHDEPYSADFADVYDLIYADGRKDYAAETEALVQLIRDRHPSAASLLDVACGTGEHLAHLQHEFKHVEGVEYAAPMRAKAAAKLPGVAIHPGDMRDFDLGRTFDVVTCLFSSIGYTSSTDELQSAIRAMAAHVAEDGLLIVDPWFYVGDWEGGHLEHHIATGDGRTLLRLAHSRRDGRKSSIDYHYLVGDQNGGIRYFVDTHDTTLYTKDEYQEAFRAAGFTHIEFVQGWSATRGRIVGRR